MQDATFNTLTPFRGEFRNFFLKEWGSRYMYVYVSLLLYKMSVLSYIGRSKRRLINSW